MGRHESRLNSEFKVIWKNYSWLKGLIYRKDPFWYVDKFMIL